MNGEAVINLVLEAEADSVLVSCEQFPLLNLSLPDRTDNTIQRVVLPVLQKMVEFKVGYPVELRLVDTFLSDGDAAVAPHVIASRQLAHVA